VELIVDSAESLRALREPGRRGTVRRVRLGGPLADERLEKRLNDAYFACGCDTGSIAVSLTLAACVAGGVVTHLHGAFGPWHIAGYLAAAAIAGKTLGLAAARIRLRRITRRLRARLAAPPGLR
jgi:hypothetical protein